MKKLLKIAGIIALVMVILVITLIVLGLRSASQARANREKLRKNDADLIGERLVIPRSGQDGVNVNLYIPEHGKDELLPVVFNIHGGAFIGGDADTLDTQSDRISRNWHMIVVTINYTKADTQSIEYAVEEVRDTVLYFRDHRDEYDADPEKFVVLGYSAGGYHALASAISLKQSGFELAAQVLCYPYIRDALDIFESLDSGDKQLAPALFVLAGTDPISEGARPYMQALKDAGVPTEVIEYADAFHGFIEENNPEYENEALKDSWKHRTAEQEEMARDAEEKIFDWLSGLF